MDKQTVNLYQQWLLGSIVAQGDVLPKPIFKGLPERNYNLKDKVFRKFLQYEDQTFGINIGWTDDASIQTGKKVARWFFARNGQSQAPITFGESIALGLGNPRSFVHYSDRLFGINLDWSRDPVFEWQLLGGKKGDPVKTNMWIAIYNMKINECLISFDRTVGGDIGWPSSKTWEDTLGSAVESLVKKAKDEAITYLLTAAAASLAV